MRFFAHDGKSTHGPAGIDELLKLPGFDGDTLVCPVGSNDTADWKPALAYPPFKKALLEAPVAAPKQLPPMPAILPALPEISKPVQLPVPPPFFAAPPAAAEPPKSARSCPSCAHENLEDARFCNACGARMDGTIEAPPAPASRASDPLPAPEPAYDAFAPLDPLRTYPPEPAPAPAPMMPMTDSPRRPLQPGKMGQLGAYEESGPVASEFRPVPTPAPEPAASVPVWKRPAVLAAVAGAAVVACGLAYTMLGKSPTLDPVAELTPAAETPADPMAIPGSSPGTLPSQPVYSAPPPTASPAMPPPHVRKARKIETEVETTKPNRSRKRRAAVAELRGDGDTIIESSAPDPEPKAKGKRAAKAARAKEDKDPLLEALLTDSAEPAAEAAAEPAAQPIEKSAPTIGQRPSSKPGKFALPGLERKVSASDRSPAPPADSDASALTEPGKSTPPPGIEDEPVKSAEGDQLALVQVHEQFDFCTQLLAQAAYGDHYDTCLCKDTREASPYRGRRGYYVSAKKKEASSGMLETSAKIQSSKIDHGVALVKARWKASTGDKGRDATQTWKLEDGLWCQAP